MTDQVIRPIIHGLREYPPLIFAWQKWPMQFESIDCRGKFTEIAISIFYHRGGLVLGRFFQARIPSEKIGLIEYNKSGPTHKTFERFYRLAHLSFSHIAAGDPAIQAFAPGVDGSITDYTP